MKRIFSLLLAISLAFVLVTNTSAVRYIGDVDGDGKVNSYDALQILRYAVGSLKFINTKIADLNSDGKINSADALLVLKIAVLGLEGDYGQGDEEGENKIPSSKAEIVEYFNTAINKVKTEPTAVVQQIGVTNYLASATTISSGIQGIYKMLGGDDWLDQMLKDNSQGAATYTGADIKAKFPVEGESWASKLTEADVTSASCTDNNGVYTIKITTIADAKSEGHKHGQGHAPKAFNVILPDVVNENIPGVAKSMVGTASMAYPSSTVVITVDAATGNVLTAEYDLKWTINFDKMGIILPFGTKSIYTIRWDGNGDGGDYKEEEVKAPSSKADIVACYNSAINKVVSSKAGFKKSRETVMHNLDGGALFKIQLVVDMVNDFLGVGTTQWDNKKGEQNNLSKASLTEADLTGATCVDNNGIYTITLTLKDGSSSADGSGNVDTSPLQRAGVFAGKGDKKAYDYKNSENIHTAINGVDDCTAESAIEKVTNTKIVAVVDSKTGKLQSLTASWDWYVELTQVKYTIVGIKQAKGNATTTVKLTNVQW